MTISLEIDGTTVALPELMRVELMEFLHTKAEGCAKYAVRLMDTLARVSDEPDPNDLFNILEGTTREDVAAHKAVLQKSLAEQEEAGRAACLAAARLRERDEVAGEMYWQEQMKAAHDWFRHL